MDTLVFVKMILRGQGCPVRITTLGTTYVSIFAGIQNVLKQEDS